MSEKVYVVFGSTGEYSDHQYWSVAAYSDQAKAELHASEANAWCEAHGYHNSRAPEVKCPWDDNFTSDYTGTKYHVERIPVGGYPRTPEPLAAHVEQARRGA